MTLPLSSLRSFSSIARRAGTKQQATNNTVAKQRNGRRMALMVPLHLPAQKLRGFYHAAEARLVPEGGDGLLRRLDTFRRRGINGHLQVLRWGQRSQIPQ